MKKIIMNLLGILVLLSSEAQTPLESSNFIPKVTTPTPEAFSFTRYGDIPVGLFTGSMNYSIPLFTVKKGKLSMPVSFDYASNGVKVDAVAGKTGMDWTLRVGGVITRNILGKSEESQALIGPSSPDSSSTDFYNWAVYVGTNRINTQPDEYTYSFQGLSGKFYFDYAGNIKQLTPNGLQITRASNQFKIVTPDGTQYYFTVGDINYSYSLFGSNDGVDAASGGQTSWYLTKQKNMYGDSILYSYTAATSEYISSLSQTYNFAVLPGSWLSYYMAASNCVGGFGDFATVIGYAAPGIASCPNMTPALNTDVRISNMYALQLDEVNFGDGKLKFYYSSRDDLPDQYKLDSIDLLATEGNKRLKTVGFEYTYSQSGPTYNYIGHTIPAGNLPDVYTYLKKRLYCSSLKVYNSTKSTFEKHDFEYNGMNDLPPRLSFAQDFWGYFNGKMNTSLLPDNTLYSPKANFPSLGSTRNVDAAFSQKGVLTKITYPTGGHTNIVYEANLARYIDGWEKFDTISTSINYIGSNITAYSSNFTMKFAYKIELTADWTVPPDPEGPQPQDPGITFSIENLTDNPGTNDGEFTTFVPIGQTRNLTNYLGLLERDDLYRLKIVASDYNVKGTARLIQWQIATDPDTNKLSASAGARVASIRNYTDSNKLVAVKKFNYNDPTTGFAYSSGTSITSYSDARDFCYTQVVNCGIDDITGTEMVISSHSSLGGYTNDYASVCYQYVTELLDSAGVSGSTTTQFLIGANKLPTTFACRPPDSAGHYSPYLIQNAPHTNTGYMSGKEFKKTIFRNDGGVSKKVAENTNYYSTDARLYHVDSFYAVRENVSRTRGLTKYWADFDINEYKRITAWVHLDSTIAKQYDDGDREMITKTNYVYGNSAHLQPTLIWQLNSKGDTTKKVTQYTHDVQALDPYNTVLNNMVSNNMTVIPLVSKAYKNSTLLSTTEIEYNAELLPATFKIAKGAGSLQLEAEYDEYDAKGNVLQYTTRNGVANSFIWDTKGMYPVAEAVHAKSNEIFHDNFEEGTGWDGSLTAYDNTKSHTGAYSGRIDKPSAGEQFTYSSKYLTVSLSAATKFKYSGWIYSNGPNVQLWLIMNDWAYSDYIYTAETNKWVYIEKEFSVPSDVTKLALRLDNNGSGSVWFDDLRIHPAAAQMKTYTYRPLVGMTSETDANNQVIHYEYDPFNRLIRIRDKDGNIIKRMDYKYHSTYLD